MKKNISVVRCDSCGKRTYQGKYHIIETKHSLGNCVHQYEICDECMTSFLKGLEYKNKMEKIWDHISEEKLIEE